MVAVEVLESRCLPWQEWQDEVADTDFEQALAGQPGQSRSEILCLDLQKQGPRLYQSGSNQGLGIQKLQEFNDSLRRLGLSVQRKGLNELRCHLS